MIAAVRNAGELTLRLEPAAHLIEKKEDLLYDGCVSLNQWHGIQPRDWRNNDLLL